MAKEWRVKTAFIYSIPILAMLALAIFLIVFFATKKDKEKYDNVQICVDKNGDYSQPQNGLCPAGSTLQTNYGPHPPKGGVARYIRGTPNYGPSEWDILASGGTYADGNSYRVQNPYGGGTDGPNKFYNNPYWGSYRGNEGLNYGVYPGYTNYGTATCPGATYNPSTGSTSCESIDGGRTWVPPGAGQGDADWDANNQDF